MRIVLADDDTLLREGLRLLLTAEGFEVAAVTDGPASFIEAIREHRPDLAIVDVRMPPTHTNEGITAAVAAREVIPGLPVVVLSAYVEHSFASELLREGARGIGYLLKERVGRVESFLESLHRVHDGGTAIDPEVVAQLFSRRAHPLQALTEREREVLGLMAQGHSNSTIAQRLFVTGHAVQKHIRSIFAKLELRADDGRDRRVAAVLTYLEGSEA
ncbi:response regulator transcription factor [Natronoglycomyces albus]|uniref:Response regulator transcription factor n=1 Tax=Natronoglycomyces albus TaxID=2811108 RepID=A0A895XU02_9ACTN|nr:response regulator transcription factor [Natronoglycomyces albus]QSB05730.1 response regulator transcription factor [Natronoglycomyces albus]